MDGSVQQHVTASEVERFWQDGVLCLRGLFAGWVEPMRVAIEEALAAPGPLAQNPAREDYGAAGHERVRSFHIELGLWSRHPTFRAFALESPAADLAASLMAGSAVNLFFDQLFVKEPGSPEQVTPWHQDQAYWPIRGDQVVSIWVPFDRVTQANGALRYVRGSHRWGVHFGPRDFGPAQRMLKGIEGDAVPDIDAHPDRYEVLTWDLEPGDCLVHHGMTLHGATGNASGSVRRRAHSIRFTGDDVRWDPRPGILDRIPRMTTSPLSLRAGDALTCDAFPVVRAPLGPRAVAALNASRGS
jgi:ectoine hydroxylase-related dioxygenase (phytanoyl-CoA dioxygenase family)